MLIPTKSAIPFGARRKLEELGAIFGVNARFAFHLAGSFYFGVATYESDVDLYTELRPGLVEFLESLGFKRLHDENSSYPDMTAEEALRDAATNTFAVFEHTRLNVHVQVFYDLDLALRARDILAKVFNAEHARTRGGPRGQMWRIATEAALELRSLATPA